AGTPLPKVTTDHDAFKESDNCIRQRLNQLLQVKGSRSIREIHRELGQVLWDHVGMSRTDASLRAALEAIPKLRDEFWHDLSEPELHKEPLIFEEVHPTQRSYK